MVYKNKDFVFTIIVAFLYKLSLKNMLLVLKLNQLDCFWFLVFGNFLMLLDLANILSFEISLTILITILLLLAWIIIKVDIWNNY